MYIERNHFRRRKRVKQMMRKCRIRKRRTDKPEPRPVSGRGKRRSKGLWLHI